MEHGTENIFQTYFCDENSDIFCFGDKPTDWSFEKFIFILKIINVQTHFRFFEFVKTLRARQRFYEFDSETCCFWKSRFHLKCFTRYRLWKQLQILTYLCTTNLKTFRKTTTTTTTTLNNFQLVRDSFSNFEPLEWTWRS